MPHSHTVLVVDDEPEVINTVEDLLRLDSRVLGATRAQDALQILDGEEVHIVMSDQRMPGMTGVEFLSCVRDRHPEVIGILFTAYTELKTVIDAINRGHVYRYVSKPWDPGDLQAVIRQAAQHYQLLSDRARLAEELSVRNAELQAVNAELAQAYEATLEGWSKALELRDQETLGHTKRVTEITVRLALLLGMTGAEVVHMRRGALLHDIGKMGLPDSILLKPGPLTDEERKVVMRHPLYAYQLLYSIPFLRPALDIPYCHHERWDGGGYPRGLRGEQIPLAARAFAVVDAWDALRSDRPYRRGLGEEEVRTYLHAQAGKHFDPRVVELFLHMLG